MVLSSASSEGTGGGLRGIWGRGTRMISSSLLLRPSGALPVEEGDVSMLHVFVVASRPGLMVVMYAYSFSVLVSLCVSVLSGFLDVSMTKLVGRMYS